MTIEAAQGTSHAPRSRLLTLTSSGTVVSTYDEQLLSGSVTYDRTREVRRSGEVALVDEDGDLTPTDLADEFAPGQRLRLERGVAGAGYLSLGTFVVAAFDGEMAGRLVLRLEDTTDALRQDFGSVVTVPRMSRAWRALRLLWEPVLGDGTDWDLDDGSAVVGSAVTYAEDDERLHSTVALMADLGLEVYTDRAGVPVLAPLADPTTLAVDHTFEQATGVARGTRITRSGDFRPYNRQVVVGEPPDAPVVRGEAVITDPSHPWHPDRIGFRTAPVYRSGLVATRYAATVLARSILYERAWTDSIRWSGIPDITVEASDLVRFIEPQTQTDDRYRIDRVTLPVTTGQMSIDATLVVPLFEGS